MEYKSETFFFWKNNQTSKKFWYRIWFKSIFLINCEHTTEFPNIFLMIFFKFIDFKIVKKSRNFDNTDGSLTTKKIEPKMFTTRKKQNYRWSGQK